MRFIERLGAEENGIESGLLRGGGEDSGFKSGLLREGARR